MQLVLWCREQDYKYFGTLYAIAGDNLGSHNIGVFISLLQIRWDDFFYLGKKPQSEQLNLTIAMCSSWLSAGIKFDLKCNDLSFFHACQPELPLCSGHDLFEGVVSCDLALYNCHLITEQKEFSYLELNSRINLFRYLGNDAYNKPTDVNPGSEKLSGHAVQNWSLLRDLAILLGDKIRNPVDNEVWQLVLQLKQIVELISAPKITTGQVIWPERGVPTKQKRDFSKLATETQTPLFV